MSGVEPVLAETTVPHARMAPLALAPVHRCPLCERELSPRWLRKIVSRNGLYGVTVCKRCRTKFANRRQFAYLLDNLALAGIPTLIQTIYDVLLPSSGGSALPYFSGTPSDSFLLLLNWMAIPLVFTLKDGFAGYSPFKYLLGLRVVDRVTREPIGFARSFQRNLVLLLPYLGFVLAVTTMMKGRRIGDGWARTDIVWLKYRHKRPFDPRINVCHTCGYDLTGNVSGRCPECGLEIPNNLPAP